MKFILLTIGLIVVVSFVLLSGLYWLLKKMGIEP